MQRGVRIEISLFFFPCGAIFNVRILISSLHEIWKLTASLSDLELEGNRLKGEEISGMILLACLGWQIPPSIRSRNGLHTTAQGYSL